MAREKKRDRSNLGEQVDSGELERTSVERPDRSMGAGSREDRNAGAEGIEDPAINRSDRGSLTGNRFERRGERMAGSPGESRRERMSGTEREASREKRSDSRQQQPERSRESKEETSSFEGQGGQKGGSPEQQGTGHTSTDRTDESEQDRI